MFLYQRIVAAAVLTAVPVLALVGGRVAATTQAAPIRAASAHILVNAQGLTLYLFTADRQNQSNCTGQCAVYWPPVILSTASTAPAAIAGVQGTFAVARRADGQRQLTYNGSPLYTFIKDKVPGDVTGQGVQGTWWVAVVNTTPATAATAVPTAASTTGDDNHNNRHGNSQSAATPRAKSSCYYGTCVGATPTVITGYYGSSTASPTPAAAGGYYGGGHG
jgi:predicted lipoprotein with Yx(FWY)xxD motif